MVKISGGDKLEKALSEIAKNAKKASKVKVGFLGNATYPDGTSVAMVAAIQEFGAPSRNIPPRPFFRDMIADKSKEWPDAIASLLIANKYNAHKTLAVTGDAIVGQLQYSIKQFDKVPLKPATIKRKGFDKQLIDTAVMWRSISREVE